MYDQLKRRQQSDKKKFTALLKILFKKINFKKKIGQK